MGEPKASWEQPSSRRSARRFSGARGEIINRSQRAQAIRRSEEVPPQELSRRNDTTRGSGFSRQFDHNRTSHRKVISTEVKSILEVNKDNLADIGEARPGNNFVTTF